MKYILFIVLTMTVFGAYAEEIFPAGCTPLVVHDELLKLAADKPSVVMVHNLSKIDLWITHPVSELNASRSFSSRLQSGNWSALALDNKSFDLSCIESRPGHEQQVPCEGLLAVCQWLDVTAPKGETGTFWAGEDMILSALTAHLGSRGFVLTAPAQ